jgi:hypothetical protein
MTTFDIEFINTTKPTVDYSAQAESEYEQGMGSRIEEYTLKFEQQYDLSEGDDIGGLIVYEGRAVYDYENFVGWVV